MLDIMAYTLEVPVNLVECTVTFSNEMHSGAIVIGDEFVDDGSGVIGHTYHYEYFAFIIVRTCRTIGLGVALGEGVASV